jgi:hypothetical protein
MDLLNRALTAAFAYSCATRDDGQPRRFPPDPVTPWRTSLPSWVRLSALKLRLPFRHAVAVAKRENGVEVSSGARHLLSAPIAGLCDAVGSTWVWFSDLALLLTPKRAVFLVPFAGTGAWVPAYFAGRLDGDSTPSVIDVAGSGTEPSGGPAWVELDATVKTVDHTLIIPPIEIEEKYCAIAVDRLRQSVMDFGGADTSQPPRNGDLFGPVLTEGASVNSGESA